MLHWMMCMSKKNIFIICLLILFVFLAYIFEINKIINLDNIIKNHAEFKNYINNNYIFSTVIFIILYSVSIAINIPVATVFTLAAGILFGSIFGTVFSSFASVLGATFAFLISRYVLKDYFSKKYKSQLENVNKKLEKDGVSIIFMLRMVPLFPFFIVNILLGLTSVKTFTYVWISAIGMLPATFIYVNFGAQLNPEKFQTGVNFANIIDINMIIALSLIGVLPFISKQIINLINRLNKNV